MLGLRYGRILRVSPISRQIQTLLVRNLSSKPPKSDETSDITKRRIPVLKNKMKSTARVNSNMENKIKLRKKRKDGEECGFLERDAEAEPQSERLVAQGSAEGEGSGLMKPVVKPNYISFADFPKVPESILQASTKDLYSSIGQKLDNEESNLNSSKQPETFVDFAIPEKYLKSKIRQQITDKDRAIVEELDNFSKSEDEKELAQSQLKLIKLYYDQDTNSFQPLPEHSLKKTLSGMLNLNPNLDDIDDEYLWKLIPKDKIFGVPPFEQKIEVNGFKKWETEKLKHLKLENSNRDSNIKEFKEFEKQFTKTKSFFKKIGSRKRVDHKLIRKYKKLKQEGKIPSNLNDNDNDDPL